MTTTITPQDMQKKLADFRNEEQLFELETLKQIHDIERSLDGLASNLASASLELEQELDKTEAEIDAAADSL